MDRQSLVEKAFLGHTDTEHVRMVVEDAGKSPGRSQRAAQAYALNLGHAIPVSFGSARDPVSTRLHLNGITANPTGRRGPVRST